MIFSISSPNVVFGDLAWGGVLGELVENLLRQPRRKIVCHVITLVGFGTGACSVPPKCARRHPHRACRNADLNYKSLALRVGPFGVPPEGGGGVRKDLLEVHPIAGVFGLEEIWQSVTAVTPWRMAAAVL